VNSEHRHIYNTETVKARTYGVVSVVWELPNFRVNNMIPHNERSARVEKLYLRLLIPRDEHGDIQLYKIGSFQCLPRGF